MSDHVLVIDDDPTFNAVLVRGLQRRGWEVRGCCEPDEALVQARACRPQRIVLDLNLAGRSGLALIQPLLAVVPQARIVVLTGYASVATAVDAIKLGATHYLAKPATVTEVLKAFDTSLPQPEPELDAEPMSVSRVEWEHIQKVLSENGGNISATARALKMHRRTLQRKLFKRPAAE